MNWRAIGRGFVFGLKVAGKLVTLGIIHGKAGKIVEVTQKIEQAIDEARAEP